jgi:hypothetical protein
VRLQSLLQQNSRKRVLPQILGYLAHVLERPRDLQIVPGFSREGQSFRRDRVERTRVALMLRPVGSAQESRCGSRGTHRLPQQRELFFS